MPELKGKNFPSFNAVDMDYTTIAFRCVLGILETG
jgi:hypothetical protein